MIKLYNTLNRKKETLKPIKKGKVGLYTCGPTVYWFAHIGNLRTFLFEDVLKRVLEYNGYKVRHIMNITDVGHLTSDADVGEDKMEKGAKREKKTVWQVAEFYTKAFKKDLKRLNILPPDHWIKATQTIKDQIVLIKTLEEKGFTYKTSDGIYFDTSKLKTYGRLTGRKKKKIKAGARIKMVEGKKNPTDFALWKFSLKGQKRQMEWSSPWGIGFPGWHTECVVMSIKKLGIPFDVHCGGIDHVSIHHPNEIAQAEVAYGKIFANHWLHGEFLTLKEGKMAKSEGNIITLEDLIKKGFNPLAYRYLSFNAHYRSKCS
jgi:cysteinyl-tRNA synthetase